MKQICLSRDIRRNSWYFPFPNTKRMLQIYAPAMLNKISVAGKVLPTFYPLFGRPYYADHPSLNVAGNPLFYLRPGLGLAVSLPFFLCVPSFPYPVSYPHMSYHILGRAHDPTAHSEHRVTLSRYFLRTCKTTLDNSNAGKQRRKEGRKKKVFSYYASYASLPRLVLILDLRLLLSLRSRVRL